MICRDKSLQFMCYIHPMVKLENLFFGHLDVVCDIFLENYQNDLVISFFFYFIGLENIMKISLTRK